MFENVFANRFAVIATFFAVPIAFLADYSGVHYAYAIAALFVLLFFLLAYWDERNKQKLYNKPNIPIPVVFNISNPSDSKSALGSLFETLEQEYPKHEENLKKYFNITSEDLIFKYDGDIFDEARFTDFLKIAKHDIKRLEARTPKNVHFHMVYIGPIANAILVGTMLGTEGVTLYQYNKSTDSYTVALNIDSRAYKEHIQELHILRKHEIGDVKGSPEVTVAIDLASHKIALEKLTKPIIHLESTVGATLHTPEEFIQANQEIYSVINNLQQHAPHITLAYSMPTTIGILLGMSIQNYWDITLTQYSDGEYKPVIQHLNKIKYYF